MVNDVKSKTEGLCWFALGVEEVLKQLRVSLSGLTEAEVVERRGEYGPNSIPRAKGDSPLVLLWRQINSPLIWVLLGSAALAMALGKLIDGSTVLAVVILNSIIGFIQEFKAGKAIEALIEMVPENTTVIRDGHKITLPAAELVPGDIVMLTSGDRVPADMRLVSHKNLQVEEAALTGESVPAQKNIHAVREDAGIGDRLCMVFSGTMVTYGTAMAVVTGTGMRTELGKISRLLNEAVNLETPLTSSLKVVAKYITFAILVITILIVAVGTFRVTANGFPLDKALIEMMIFAVALAVAAIPEGLPAIMTIALGVGVQRMAKRKAIVRKLPAVETLGSTTVICSDKTGTLTKNEMTVQSVWTPSGSYEFKGVGYEPVGDILSAEQVLTIKPPYLERLLTAATVCNDSTLIQDRQSWTITGDPTEAALVVAARKLGLVAEQLRSSYRLIDAIPFESENQFMATFVQDPNGEAVAFVKGAPEVILKRCRFFADGQAIDERRVLSGIETMASIGMRVLAIAEKRFASTKKSLDMPDIKDEIVFLGLVGMIDPPRQEAIAAIKECQAAGVTVKMITGDHRLTAQAIGIQLGLIKDHTVVTGAQIEQADNEQLRHIVDETNVFARVAPEHKLRLVSALQKNNHIAAMTGDGVNDAPALKQANIGVAMGITGTSVSKAAADIVLTDDNFATITAAVEEGRRVYDNLIKSLAFVLPTNIGLALILVYAVIFFPFDFATKDLLLPMQPAQLLWINLIMTVALALPLAFEHMEPDIMTRHPRSPNAPIFNKFLVTRTIIASILMTIGAIVLFKMEYSSAQQLGMDSKIALSKAQTMALTTVIMFQIFYMLNCRSLKNSVLEIGLLSNWTIYLGILGVLLAQAAVIYLPWMSKIFSTTPIDLKDWGMAALMGMIILPVVAIEKMLRR
ncbi:MAG: HAD-IC family P-type ATPase [Deltaproteobacteria bacterium]|nr:HAD-IC family P-type ATPase [Deltaproteobacteria bacterium]